MSGQRLAFVLYVSLAATATAGAQEHQHQHPAPSNIDVPQERQGSGTSWLPDDSPMYAMHGRTLGGWSTMLHGVAFVQYLRDEEPRGASQFGSVNWIMGQAIRSGTHGTFTARGMLSLEPLTIRGCGYPDLLATGEVCDGHPIVDRQHPHDLIIEAAASYVRPLTANVALQLYGGVAGEPALGPVAFPHRLSAWMNPIAPVTHHWLDATHVTYGVFTGGVFGRQWHAEASAFNGREPDDQRYDLDLSALDSYSGRLTFLPTPRWALQVSAGHLEEAEQDDGERVDVDRVTASAIHHRRLADGGLMASTIAWGRNLEGGQATHALLTEAALALRDRDVFFARGEVVQKASHDLDLHDGEDTHTVGKLQFGYTRFLPPARGWRIGVGGSVSLGVVSAALAPTYGGRVPLGGAVFLVVRPAAMGMTSTAAQDQ